MSWTQCEWCGQGFDRTRDRYNWKYTAKDGIFGKDIVCCGAKCYEEAKASFRAKKEAKEAKKAAKQAAHEEEYESDGGSSSSGEIPSGCVKIVGMILAFLVVCGILGALFYKNEDANDPAVKMAKWEEHLEKRSAAFAEGLSEEGVEARGLKNYTWEEWQTLQKKGQANPVEKEVDIGELWREHLGKRNRFLGAGHNDAEAHAVGLDDYTLDEFRKNYKNIKYKTLEEIKQSAAETASTVASPAMPAESVDAAEKAKAEAAAKAKAAAEAEAKKDAAIKEKMEAKARMKAEAEAKAKAKAEAEAKASAKTQTAAKARAEAAAKAEAEARARSDARARAEEAKAKEGADRVVAADAVGEQQNGADRKKASADSKGIAITVQGKGANKDAALRSAIRQAVFKTVGTWVGSKTRMEERRAEVNAQVETVTQDDIRKFEVLDTQQEGDAIVLKVKVHVSKKKIAPKFEKVFPDVFGNN